MNRIRAFAAALVAPVILASPAVAQDDDGLSDLVATWIDNQMPDLDPVVFDYGNACITPLVLALPDQSKELIAEIGDMDRGLNEVQAANPEDLETFLPALQICVETLFIAETISWWVDAEYDDIDAEERAETITCFIGVVEPLSTAAKQFLFTAADFEEGVEALLESDLEVDEGFEDAVEACD